jgi:hypothetical protein
MTATAIVGGFFQRLMELSPVEATYHGLHRYDHLLPEGGLQEARARERLLEGLATELRAAGEGDLEADIARFYADMALFAHRELRLWERMADAPDTIGTAIFLLFSREFAPLEDRLESIAARMESVPAFLAASRERLRDPVRLWCAIAAETARQLPGLFGTVAAAAPEGTLRRRLETAGGNAGTACEEFARWLETEVAGGASGGWAIGEERFTSLLRLRRLPDPPAAILALGRRYLAEAKEERTAVISRSWPGRSLEEVDQDIRSRHPAGFEAAPGRVQAGDRRREGLPGRSGAGDAARGRGAPRGGDPRLPATGDPLRGLRAAGLLRRAAAGHLHRHPAQR